MWQDTNNMVQKIKLNLQVAIGKQVLNEGTVNTSHASMMDCKTIRNQIPQIRVCYLKQNYAEMEPNENTSMQLALIALSSFPFFLNVL